MLIRRLTTLDDCRKVAALERVVWGYSDSEDVVPPPVLIVSTKRGGILLGAFEGSDDLKGFVFSMPGVKDGHPIQWPAWAERHRPRWAQLHAAYAERAA